jgi:hypothetical protein
VARGSFEEERFHPTCFSVWVLLPGIDQPVGFDSVEEAIEVIKLETLWACVPESKSGHG